MAVASHCVPLRARVIEKCWGKTPRNPSVIQLTYWLTMIT